MLVYRNWRIFELLVLGFRLPSPSVTVSDQTVSKFSDHILRYSAPGSGHFYVENKFSTTGRQLIQCHCSSETIRVNHKIMALVA
jgi:hypothetical protein